MVFTALNIDGELVWGIIRYLLVPNHPITRVSQDM